MSQSDLVLERAGVSGNAFANDIEAALKALWSLQKGPAAPPTPAPGVLWLDDSSAPWVLKMRNGADDAWIEVMKVTDADLSISMVLKLLTMTGAILATGGTAGAPGYGFSGDPDTGLYRAGENQAAVTAGGVAQAEFGATYANLLTALRFSGVVQPPQLTADQNNYSPAGLANASMLRLSADAPRTITGLSGGSEGRILSVTNFLTPSITLAHLSGSSSSVNRFAFPGGTGLVLTINTIVTLRYDATSAVWRMISPRSDAAAAPRIVAKLTNLTGAPAITTIHSAQGALSAVRNARGDYTFSWTDTLTSPSVQLTARETGTVPREGLVSIHNTGGVTGTSVRILAYDDTASLADPTEIHVVVYGL